jgi:outer membrane protein assembly factor BamB
MLFHTFPPPHILPAHGLTLLDDVPSNWPHQSRIFPPRRAYVYSTPTVVDLDHDGKMEILVGTSVGFVYALDHKGSPLPGWPIQMGEVQAQVATADVDGDGNLEILALDTRGSAALFNKSGHLLWDVHVRSPLAQPASFGDINGDGRLEAVFGSASGEVFALDAQTGAVLAVSSCFAASCSVPGLPPLPHIV